MTRLVAFVTTLLTAGCFCQLSAAQADFRFNQLGFYPSSNKLIHIIGTTDSSFCLINSSGAVVFSGTLSKDTVWAQTTDRFKTADFSSFTTEGIYQLSTTDRGLSSQFRISGVLLRDVAAATLKSFYFQRCSIKIDDEYGGIYARSAGHPDTACYYHKSTGKDESTPPANSKGGWYDAGDYGKYIVNAGISAGIMLNFYEMYPDYFGDSISIPESKNGKSDLLDEIRYELDWMSSMQDTDGGVFHKLTSLNFNGFEMPQKDLLKRYFIGKSTTAALDFAAVFAIAGRIYADIDSVFATKCIMQAEKAWGWANLNPDSLYTANPPDVGTGIYNDNSADDEFYWAASELCITTGKSDYRSDVRSTKIAFTFLPSWSYVSSIGALSANVNQPLVDSATVVKVTRQIVALATRIVKSINNSVSRTPLITYEWGSNSIMAENGVACIHAFEITKDTQFMRAAETCADYLLGMNATGYSFITGFGSKTPMFPHHRISGSDGIAEPVPGLLVGGPNGNASDYTDNVSSYTTNEVAINWNSPAVFLFAAIDNFHTSSSTINTRHRVPEKSANSTFSVSKSGAFQIINFTTVNQGKASLRIFDLRGKLVLNLTDRVKFLSAGSHQIILTRQLSNGTYCIDFSDAAVSHRKAFSVMNH